MNITFVTTQLPPLHGGAGNSVQIMTESITRFSKHTVSILMPEPPGSYGQAVMEYFKKNLGKRSSSISLEFLPSLSSSSWKIKMFGLSLENIAGILPHHTENNLDSYFQKANPDLIVVMDPNGLAGIPHVFGHGRLPGLDYARKNNIPIIGYYFAHYIAAVKYYNPLFRLLHVEGLIKFLTRKILNQCDHVLLFSEKIQAQLIESGVKRVSTTWAEGLQLERFKRMEKTGTKKFQKPSIVFTGRLMREKNVHQICDIVLKLHQINRNFQVVIIGSGPEKKAMEKKLRPLGNVAFHEWMKQEDLFSILAKSHIYINCTDFETLGLSIAEAMFFGVVPVVFHHGGHTRFVDHGISGILCKNEGDYLFYLNYLLTHPEVAAVMGAEARKQILDKLDINRNIPKFISVLEFFQKTHFAPENANMPVQREVLPGTFFSTREKPG